MHRLRNRRTSLSLPAVITRLSVAWGAAACVTSASDDGRQSEGGRGSADPSELCDTLVDIVCGWAGRCNSERPPSDRDACVPAVRDLYEGCPPLVEGISRGEIAYDQAAMERLLDRMHGASCDTPPWHFFDEDDQRPIFVGLLTEGQSCHSYESCVLGLTCEGFTLESPQGICRPPED